MTEDPNDELKRNRRLLQAHKETKEGEKLLELLPQGHGSGLDADMVDGLHVVEILAKARGSGGGGGGSGGSALHVANHARGGSDAFDGAVHQISFQFEQVTDLPSVVAGRVVLLLTDGHVYVGA